VTADPIPPQSVAAPDSPSARRRRAIAALLGAVVLVAAGLATRTMARTQAPPAANDHRARMYAAHREASGLLAQAEPGASLAPAVPDLLRRLARALDTLAADGSGTVATVVLPPDLRADLQRSARSLTKAAEGPSAAIQDARRTLGVDGPALRAQLDRVRSALEGEVALGLTFQGSYSQGRGKEPTYGGHASAMGPAPATAPDPEAASSPVVFAEPATLPSRTFAGGPAKDHILESSGNGVALVDYDGDGWLDVYLVTAAELTAARERLPRRNALYRNRGNWTFEDVSQKAGVDAAAWGNGVCAGDADGDGRLDMYVTNWGPNLLYRNRGDGTFEEIASAAGVAAGGWSTGCAFFDADADGDLDLYVARYVETTSDDLLRARRTLTWRNGPRIMVGPAGLPGESDRFFENLGQGRFREASAQAGLADPAKAYGFAVVTTDYDDDGLVDLFVANDSNPNFLYRNLGGGRFESVGLSAGVAVNGEARAQAGMGADAGDVDGDGRLDLALTAFAHDRNTVYRNLDGRLFEDATVDLGLAASTFQRMGWGITFLDADLDGRSDLFVANGHIFADVGDYPALGETYRQKNQLLLNAGTRFRDVSAAAGAGLQVEQSSRGLAAGDLDNDGDPDLVVSNMDAPPTLLENRQRTGHAWIGLAIRAPAANRFAIGARVTVTAGGRTQVREIRSGGSFLSQSDLRVLFGLGTHAGPVSVEVRMPGGDRWAWRDLAAGRYHPLELSPATKLAAGAGVR
jgi:hypothetical protein